MSYFSISALINASVSLLLGVFVLYKDPKARLNRNLFFWCMTVAFWSAFYFIWQIETVESEALLWTRLLMLGAVWVPIAYFKVVVIFLDIEKEKKIFLIFNYILSVFFSLLLLTPLMVKSVEPNMGFLFWPRPGIAYAPFLLMFIGLSFYSVYLSYNALKRLSPLKRAQIKLMLFGIAVSIAGGSTNYFLWYDIPIKPYGNILASTYVVFTIYAIVAHRLMDIKMVMRRYSVYLVSLISILIPAVAIKYIVSLYFYDFSVWVDVLLLVLLISIFSPIKHFYYRLANKYFFSSLYDGQEVIANLSDKLRSTLEINRVYRLIYETLNKAFHIKSFSILILNQKSGNYIIKYAKGLEAKQRKKFPNSKELSKILMQPDEPIIVEEISSHHYNSKTKQVINSLIDLKIAIINPLSTKDEITGLMILGPKESGDMYNDEDLRVLKVIGAQAAMAIENGILYLETLDFNVKLTEEIAKATFELKRANRKLKKLDQAKSDFISIASHQLRTPLTVIKGYISMILDGNFGKLNPSQKDSLEKVFESGERLIKLVENLLNISRIESGRLKFDFKFMRLEKIVDSVVEELSNNARRKGLVIKYEKPDEPLAKLKIDEEKIRQVVMNLVDNAVKYSSKGEVKVTLRVRGKNIRFCVEDDGMGIKQEDLVNLFKKFSRGTGTFTIHTEGTGLGLYVAKQMIDFHKGKIWAESEGEKQGSKFCFELPVK